MSSPSENRSKFVAKVIGIGLLVVFGLQLVFGAAENMRTYPTLGNALLCVVLIFIGGAMLKGAWDVMGEDEEKSTQDSPEMMPQEAAEIVKDYFKVLKTDAPAPLCVADVAKLPHPKQKIKSALIRVMKGTERGEVHDAMKASYILLADWQEGVGETDQGLDISKLDKNKSIEERASHVLSHSKVVDKWQPIIEAEEAKLKEELVGLGLW